MAEVVGSLGLTSIGVVHIKSGRVILIPETCEPEAFMNSLLERKGLWKAADTYEFGEFMPEALRKRVRELVAELSRTD